jgi:hemerythrin-like domain-containing protein
MRATEILQSEHRVIEHVLEYLEAITTRAHATGALDGPAARDAVDFFRHFADGCHHGKEEQQLFPFLASCGFDPAQGPIAVMRAEHERGREYLRGMEANVEAASLGDAAALSDFAQHARALVRLLREHIWKEDHCLFPMADRVLSEKDQHALIGLFEDVEHGKMKEGTHEHYLALADELAVRLNMPRASSALNSGGPCCSHSRP